MSIVRISPFAALAFVLLAASSQAQAAPRHHYHHRASYERHVHTSSFDSTYRDPTTREALDEGAW
ncbi:hypothetical protein DFP91_5303 [Pseudorhodoplanes sinuspersici]|nr:hypothetical protein DFP91_5303 [Pseudorhodoplanes sinuspersici]